MALLFGLSVVFMAVAFLARRRWTLALPFLVWLAIAALDAVGVLGSDTTFGSALLAGVVGALFAVAGLVMGDRAARLPPKA